MRLLSLSSSTNYEASPFACRVFVDWDAWIHDRGSFDDRMSSFVPECAWHPLAVGHDGLVDR